MKNNEKIVKEIKLINTRFFFLQFNNYASKKKEVNIRPRAPLNKKE